MSLSNTIGATLVKAKEDKNKKIGILEEKILTFCTKPKTSSQLIQLFPGRVSTNIWSTIEGLIKKGKLERVADKYLTALEFRNLDVVMTVNASNKEAKEKDINWFANEIEDMDIYVEDIDKEKFDNILNSILNKVDPKNELDIASAIRKLSLEKAKLLYNDLLELHYEDYDSNKESKKADNPRFKSDEDIAKEFEDVKILGVEINKEWESSSQFNPGKISIVVSGWIDLEFPHAGESVGGGMEEDEGPANITDQWIMYNKSEPDKIAFNNWYPEKIYSILRDTVKEKVLGKESKKADKGQLFTKLDNVSGNPPKEFSVDKKSGNPPKEFNFTNKKANSNLKLENIRRSVDYLEQKVKNNPYDTQAKEDLKKWQNMLNEEENKVKEVKEIKLSNIKKAVEEENENNDIIKKVDIDTIANDLLLKWVDGETRLVELHQALHEVYGETAEQIFEIIMEGIDEVVLEMKEVLNEEDLEQGDTSEGKKEEAVKAKKEYELREDITDSFKKQKAFIEISNYKDYKLETEMVGEKPISLEAFKHKVGWTIMNGASWSGRNKMSVEDIIELNNVNRKYSIMVAGKEESYGQPLKRIFVLGSGTGYGEPGAQKTYVTDTGYGYGKTGEIIIENWIVIENREIVDKANDIGLSEKRSFWVFK